MMTIMNMTPHAITVLRDGLEPLVLPPSGQVARISQRSESAGTLETVAGAIPLVRSTYGSVEGLPEVPAVCGYCGSARCGMLTGAEICGEDPSLATVPEATTVYVVSALVRLALPYRRDLASPGPLVRDADGQPVGCRGLEVT